MPTKMKPVSTSISSMNWMRPTRVNSRVSCSSPSPHATMRLICGVNTPEIDVDSAM